MEISKKGIMIPIIIMYFLLCAFPSQRDVAHAEYSKERAVDFFRITKALFRATERFEAVHMFKRYELKVHDGVIALGNTNITLTNGAALATEDDSDDYSSSTAKVAVVKCMAIGDTVIVPTVKAPPLMDIVNASNINYVKRLLRGQAINYLKTERLVLSDAARMDIAMALDINYHYIINTSQSETEAFIKLNDAIMEAILAKEATLQTY
jgi:hypothetical protein